MRKFVRRRAVRQRSRIAALQGFVREAARRVVRRRAGGLGSGGSWGAPQAEGPAGCMWRPLLAGIFNEGSLTLNLGPIGLRPQAHHQPTQPRQ